MVSGSPQLLLSEASYWALELARREKRLSLFSDTASLPRAAFLSTLSFTAQTGTNYGNRLKQALGTSGSHA